MHKHVSKVWAKVTRKNEILLFS